MSATATITIADFVYVAGSVAFEKGGELLVTPAGSTTTVRVSTLKIGIGNASVFAGLGGRYEGTQLAPVAAGDVGLSLTNLTLGLALMKEVGTTTPRSYVTLNGSGSARLVGMSDLTLDGSITGSGREYVLGIEAV